MRKSRRAKIFFWPTGKRTVADIAHPWHRAPAGRRAASSPSSRPCCRCPPTCFPASSKPGALSTATAISSTQSAFYSVPPEFLGRTLWIRGRSRASCAFSTSQAWKVIAAHARVEKRQRFATDDAKSIFMRTSAASLSAAPTTSSNVANSWALTPAPGPRRFTPSGEPMACACSKACSAWPNNIRSNASSRPPLIGGASRRVAPQRPAPAPGTGRKRDPDRFPGNFIRSSVT